MKKLITILVLLYSSMIYANEDDQIHICYGRSMVAYDSVINARLGIPKTHAYNISSSEDFQTIILNAYDWDKSPHEYALKIFYECAIKNHDR